METPATIPPKARSSRVVIWVALVVTLLGSVLLYDLVVSAKRSRELARKPPADRSRFLGSNDTEPAPSASASSERATSSSASPSGSASAAAPTSSAPRLPR